MQKSKSGFTIVELLIVIVVIAILAAISVVAYTGIQQRATNSSIIAAANQSVKLISAYIATNGTYPFSGSTVCLVPGKTSCTAGGSGSVSINTTLNNNLTTLGSLPYAVPDALSSWNGIVYGSAGPGSRTVNGEPWNLIILYSLHGTSQQCGVANIVTGTWNEFVSSTNGYSANTGGYTLCFVAVPGP